MIPDRLGIAITALSKQLFHSFPKNLFHYFQKLTDGPHQLCPFGGKRQARRRLSRPVIIGIQEEEQLLYAGRIQPGRLAQGRQQAAAILAANRGLVESLRDLLIEKRVIEAKTLQGMIPEAKNG